jgi:hypothetical protein
MDRTCEFDVYWTVQNGRRFSISLSEPQAWESLESLWAYHEDSQGWTIERTRESVPIATAEVVEGEGEMIELTDEGIEISRTPYAPAHVFWDCPWCGLTHNTDLYGDPVRRTSPAPNPSLWFCERGKGIVLVNW